MAEALALCRRCDELFMCDGTKVCADCKPVHEAERRAARPHHHSKASRAKMRAVVRAAEADANWCCHLCTQPLPPDGYDATITADHVDASDPQSELRGAHRGCNSARGNRSIEWFRAHVLKKFPGWKFRPNA